MLNFLRKLRRSETMSSSAGRYLLYAVGEISLVVIGILIAIQIDGWRDDRELAHLRDQYTDALLADLREDSASLMYDFEFIVQDRDMLSAARARLTAPAANGDTARAVVLGGWFPFFDPSSDIVNRATLTALVQSGDVKLYPKEVRDAIIRHATLVDRTASVLRENVAILRDAMMANPLPAAPSAVPAMNEISVSGPLVQQLWDATPDADIAAAIIALVGSKSIFSDIVSGQRCELLISSLTLAAILRGDPEPSTANAPDWPHAVCHETLGRLRDADLLDLDADSTG